MLIVFTTCPNLQEAGSLADKIVNARLAACVQVLPQMTSVYMWEGKVQKEPEHLLLIKTLPEKWNELQDLIAKEHSYSVPEIAAVEAERVSGPYAEWLMSVLDKA
jgi:periplasmic divalent cation tolerance protein